MPSGKARDSRRRSAISPETLSLYYDGECPEELRAWVEEQLAADPELRAEYERLQAISLGLRDLPELSAPAGFAAGVQRRIATEERALAAADAAPPELARHARPHRPRRLGAAAAIAILAVLGGALAIYRGEGWLTGGDAKDGGRGSEFARRGPRDAGRIDGPKRAADGEPGVGAAASIDSLAGDSLAGDSLAGRGTAGDEGRRGRAESASRRRGYASGEGGTGESRDAPGASETTSTLRASGASGGASPSEPPPSTPEGYADREQEERGDGAEREHARGGGSLANAPRRKGGKSVGEAREPAPAPSVAPPEPPVAHLQRARVRGLTDVVGSSEPAQPPARGSAPEEVTWILEEQVRREASATGVSAGSSAPTRLSAEGLVSRVARILDDYDGAMPGEDRAVARQLQRLGLRASPSLDPLAKVRPEVPGAQSKSAPTGAARLRSPDAEGGELRLRGHLLPQQVEIELPEGAIAALRDALDREWRGQLDAGRKRARSAPDPARPKGQAEGKGRSEDSAGTGSRDRDRAARAVRRLRVLILRPSPVSSPTDRH